MKPTLTYYYVVEGNKIRVYSIRENDLHLEYKLDIPYHSVISLELRKHIKSDSYQIIFIEL